MLELVGSAGIGAAPPGAAVGRPAAARGAGPRAGRSSPRCCCSTSRLGALDLKLRQQMQAELKALQRQVGITFVFVTHDQDEALAMADRVAVFNQGRIEQIGTPEEVYERPRTAFVAGFVGGSNIVDAAPPAPVRASARPSRLRPERIACWQPRRRSRSSGHGGRGHSRTRCAITGAVDAMSSWR